MQSTLSPHPTPDGIPDILPFRRAPAPASPLKSAQTVEALEVCMRLRGLTFGIPRHINRRTVAIDRATCRAVRCPG
jgi:hypothetical protein